MKAFTPETDFDPHILRKIVEDEYGTVLVNEAVMRSIGFAPDVCKKDDLVRLGEEVWKRTYAHGDEDAVAVEKLMEWARDQPETFMRFFAIPQNQVLWYALGRWADQAFPTVTMGEKFCAALLATHIPEDMLDEVQAPWKAFVIEIPGRMLSVFDEGVMERTRITRVVVHKCDAPDQDPWHWIALGEKGQHVWRTGFAEQIIRPVDLDKHKASYELGSDEWRTDLSRDERLYVLVSRLVFNVCLAISDPAMIRPVGSSHKRHKEREGRKGPPEQRVFQVGQPINLDCRDAIREYIEGERPASQLKIQSLVRGHYKRQPYGPKLSLRRRQWILPYWRGPEDAPILTRPHAFKDED